MDDSILKSIKKLLGLAGDYTPFDTDVTMHINSVFFVLNQLGVGPEKAFHVTSDAETWKEFTGSESEMQLVKSYVYLRVRILFDPPGTSFVLDSMKRQADEFEWRLNVQAENGALNTSPVFEEIP